MKSAIGVPIAALLPYLRECTLIEIGRISKPIQTSFLPLLTLRGFVPWLFSNRLLHTFFCRDVIIFQVTLTSRCDVEAALGSFLPHYKTIGNNTGDAVIKVYKIRRKQCCNTNYKTSKTNQMQEKRKYIQIYKAYFPSFNSQFVIRVYEVI